MISDLYDLALGIGDFAVEATLGAESAVNEFGDEIESHFGPIIEAIDDAIDSVPAGRRTVSVVLWGIKVYEETGVSNLPSGSGQILDTVDYVVDISELADKNLFEFGLDKGAGTLMWKIINGYTRQGDLPVRLLKDAAGQWKGAKGLPPGEKFAKVIEAVKTGYSRHVGQNPLGRLIEKLVKGSKHLSVHNVKGSAVAIKKAFVAKLKVLGASAKAVLTGTAAKTMAAGLVWVVIARGTTGAIYDIIDGKYDEYYAQRDAEVRRIRQQCFHNMSQIGNLSPENFRIIQNSFDELMKSYGL